MENGLGRFWLGLLAFSLFVVVLSFGESLPPINPNTTGNPFLIALSQLGILYIVALFIERALEVIIKSWRQSGKASLEARVGSIDTDNQTDKVDAEQELIEYKTGTQKRALLLALTFGFLVSIAGVRLLGPIFEPA